MKTILFATQNHRKLGEARLTCDMFGIKIEQVKLDFDEIQSTDPLNISRHKAESAFHLINKPVVITDTFWKIPALKGFPGGYMKYITDWFESQDFLNLMKDKKDKRLFFTESIVYKDEKHVKVFSKEYSGVFVDKPRGTGNSLENIVEFEGLTLGERRGQGDYSHKPEDYIWFDFARWFSKLRL